MSQLTIQPQTQTSAGAGTGARAVRRPPTRSERMVGLRSSMPVGLLTLRHDVPQRISHDEITPEKFTDTTPKVEQPERTPRASLDTPARKGAQAQW